MVWLVYRPGTDAAADGPEAEKERKRMIKILPTGNITVSEENIPRKKKKKRSKTKGKTTNTKNKNTEGQSENKAEPEDSAVLTGEVTEGHPGDREVFWKKRECEIFYESDKGQYKICNHSKREIHVQPVTGEIQWILKPGQKARVEDPVSVGIEGTEYVLNLR